ncbi:hypothetical protein FRC16_001539 [Serendipita sp. 398]|nr:hypothetical protein FRC16_001539 [Serendipita sp. 398]
MSKIVPYSDFQIPDNVLVNDGGSWTIEKSANEVVCRTFSRTGSCAQGCLVCTISNKALSPSYNLRYIANVSVPMSQYGNTNYLDYSFSYTFNWTSDAVAAGLPLSTKLIVGTSSNTDSFPSSDNKALWDNPNPDLGNPFSHSGTTSLLKQPGLVEWYLISRTFSITASATEGTPGFTSSAQAPYFSSSSSISSPVTATRTSLSGSISASLSGAILPEHSLMRSYTLGNNGTNSSYPINSGSTQHIPIAAIIGIVVGCNLSLGIIIFVLFLLCMRRRRTVLMQNAAVPWVTGDKVDTTWTTFTAPVRKPPLFPNVPSSSSSERNESAGPSNDPYRNRNKTMAPTPSSLLTSQLRSGSRQGHYRTLRHHFQQRRLSPPIEASVPPPAYRMGGKKAEGLS